VIHNPTSMTTCMTDHQKAFLYGACFGELAMFAVVLSKFISGPAPAAAYIAYAASVCIFLHGILRYLVTACVYHTEITASALGVTWTMVLIGTGTIYSCLYGSIWFVFVALLCALGLVKVVQAKGRIKEENAMTPGEKALHTRIQVGLILDSAYAYSRHVDFPHACRD